MMIMISTEETRTLLRTVLFLLICYDDVNSELIAKPKNAEALVRHTTFFNCSTTLASAEIHWFHYAVGDTKDRSFVYGYDQFYSNYIGRFRMEKNVATGAYNLIVSSPTVADAGMYECQDDAGRGNKGSAQLVVLDDLPMCQSNTKPHGLIGPNICGIEPEELHVTCAVQYHGNQPPLLQWRESGKVIVEGVTRNASSDRAIYNLKIKVSARMDGLWYECMTTRSTQVQYGCTSGVIKVAVNRTTDIIVGIVLSIIISLIVGCIVGGILKHRCVKRKESTNKPLYENIGTATEQVELNRVQGDSHLKDKEVIENLRANVIRLTDKISELEKLLYSPDNARYRTTSDSAHLIRTKATEERNVPVTGTAILGNNLFVVSKNYRDIEVYDAETFVFVRFIQTKEITNPLDIASSSESQCLYVINRGNEQANSEIIKVSIAGESGKYWETENDNGRLSTYESNLVVCFSKKRIIIEYSPESEMINDPVRLSPSAGFEKLWHAIKLSGTKFAVTHSKKDGRQRVCIVDNKGIISMTFEELPGFMFRMDIPICLLWDRRKFLFLADLNKKRVLLLNLNLNFEGVLLETDCIPVRLCLNESKDRVFVGMNRVNKKSETWEGGHILIHNIKG